MLVLTVIVIVFAAATLAPVALSLETTLNEFAEKEVVNKEVLSRIKRSSSSAGWHMHRSTSTSAGGGRYAGGFGVGCKDGIGN